MRHRISARHLQGESCAQSCNARSNDGDVVRGSSSFEAHKSWMRS